MKKILFIYMAPLTMALACSGKLFAQQPADPSLAGEIAKADVRPTMPDVNTGNAVSTNEINIKAVRNFVKSFKNAENVRWSKTSFGSIVYCVVDGMKTEIRYNRDGGFLYKIRTYSEHSLPGEVRARVKSVYFDFSITGVDEITSQDNLVYLVHITQNNIIKTIRVDKEDMSVYESFIKQ